MSKRRITSLVFLKVCSSFPWQTAGNRPRSSIVWCKELWVAFQGKSLTLNYYSRLSRMMRNATSKSADDQAFTANIDYSSPTEYNNRKPRDYSSLGNKLTQVLHKEKALERTLPAPLDRQWLRELVTSGQLSLLNVETRIRYLDDAMPLTPAL